MQSHRLLEEIKALLNKQKELDIEEKRLKDIFYKTLVAWTMRKYRPFKNRKNKSSKVQGKDIPGTVAFVCALASKL